jgi:hypothetical protein
VIATAAEAVAPPDLPAVALRAPTCAVKTERQGQRARSRAPVGGLAPAAARAIGEIHVHVEPADVRAAP